MSSRQTMRAAQGLYENGYITYMRTDSVTLSQEAIAAAREAVVKHFRRKLSVGCAETICHKDGRRAGSPRMHQAGGREIP
mgnify:CR=1 FL=1